MTVRAAGRYTICYADGAREIVEFELASDADYRPDVADDVTARVRAMVNGSVREHWPPNVAATDAPTDRK